MYFGPSLRKPRAADAARRSKAWSSFDGQFFTNAGGHISMSNLRLSQAKPVQWKDTHGGEEEHVYRHVVIRDTMFIQNQAQTVERPRSSLADNGE